MAMVSDGIAEPVQRVRKEFERVKSLAKLPPLLRGWTVDVLYLIRSLEK